VASGRGKATLRLLLSSETSLREDASGPEFLQALTPEQAQPAALPPVLSEQHSRTIRNGMR
jgi:menaquinone-specific isochorismate synthase